MGRSSEFLQNKYLNLMVLLTVTPATKAAIEEYCKLRKGSTDSEREEFGVRLSELSTVEIGSPVDHSKLIEVSKFLLRKTRDDAESAVAKEWRLDKLLKGANVFQAPPTPKPEPVRP